MLGLQRGVKRGRSPRTQGHRSHGAEAGSHLRDSHPKADDGEHLKRWEELIFFSLTKRKPWSGVLAVVSGNLGSRFSSAINWPCDWAGWLLMNASMCIVTLRSKQLWDGRCSANSPGLVPKSSSVPSHDPVLAGSPRRVSSPSDCSPPSTCLLPLKGSSMGGGGHPLGSGLDTLLTTRSAWGRAPATHLPCHPGPVAPKSTASPRLLSQCWTHVSDQVLTDSSWLDPLQAPQIRRTPN